MTPSQRLREAGYKRRDTRTPCEYCGKLLSKLMLPIHRCKP